MRITAELPSISDCPDQFKKFFFVKWNPKYISIQDTTHIVVKWHRALMNKSLQIGTQVASRAVLLSLVESCEKMVVGISVNELTNDKDRMNYLIASKTCSTRICKLMLRKEERATRIYLELNQRIIEAFITPETTPYDRIYGAWYVCFFCRLWKDCLAQQIEKQKKSNRAQTGLKLTIDRNFISSNIHGCVEINGHGIILFHNRCRDSGHPEQFLPTLTGSQICESGFRTFRSMSTTRCTMIDFDMHDMLGKAKRLDALNNIAENEENYNFKDRKKQNYHIPTSLLSDDEIQAAVGSGYAHVVEEFKGLGKFRHIVGQEETY